MSVVNIYEYKLNQKRVRVYRELLKDLDKVADLLYNHISYPEVWKSVQLIEEARIRYGILYKESLIYIEKHKGKVNEKKKRKEEK